jgi:ABC-2 type transport system ATP-binding protein
VPRRDVTGTGQIGVAGYLSYSPGCALDLDDPVLKPVLERIRQRSPRASAAAADGGGVYPPQRTMWAMSSASAPASVTGLAGGQPGAVIHTEDLTKIYPGTDFAAVDRLNLDVEAGEIFGLLGPNGAGKTTTAGMLTTRVVPTSGQAYLGGIDVAAHPALAKQLSGIVSQQNTLDRQLTVWENLYFHGRLFGMGAKQSRRVADELLEQFQLARWAKASVYALSGGMAQRLMVARAIFHRPSVLFLDEPTAGLDPQSRLALWDLLGELHRDGQTILLTTHYMEEADRLCQRVAIMDHGKILALDTPAALKQSIGADTVVTVKAAGDTDRLAELLAREVEGITRTRRVDGGIELHVQGGDRLVPRVVTAAERGGFDLLDLSVSEPSLETVFINLTGKELRD